MTARVGLIGAGRWGEVHRRALAEVGADLDAVLVGSEASRARVERDWQVFATVDPEALLARPLEAVIVASPNHLHATHAEMALAAGKHVLVEKPMALSIDDCERVLAAAERAGRVLAVGLEMRVFTLFERVKELLDDGDLGAPLHLALDLWRRPYAAGAGGWKSDPAKLGSSILEEPIHYLDLARWYLGEPSALQAWANSRPGREGHWENLDVRLEHGDGVRSLVTRSVAASGHSVDLRCVCERGSLRARWRGVKDLDDAPEVSLEVHDGGDRDAPATRLDVPARTGHAFDLPRQTRALLDAIRGRGAVPADGRDGLASVRMCLEVERSLRADSQVRRL